jgi:hypothetical protein
MFVVFVTYLWHGNSLDPCCLTRDPHNIVRGFARNRGVRALKLLRTAKNVKYLSKRSVNFCPAVGNPVAICVCYCLCLIFGLYVFIRTDSLGCRKCFRVSSMKERSRNIGLYVHSSEYFTSSGIRCCVVWYLLITMCHVLEGCNLIYSNIL